MNEFANSIEKWYAEHRRDLPWRNTTDPYLIWVSEIILQQTQVKQGYDYYLRFVERFPNVQSLAEAEEDEVLNYWQGLGYYSRARNMHVAAKHMHGEFPQTYEEVRALKGVGDYTAAAICSFAYKMPVAVVDGNVYRVLSRYVGIDTPIDSTKGVKLFKQLADAYLDKSRPSVYNQAIMDFGALQCTPGRPHCEACPLQETCVAFREGRVEELPVKQHKTTQTYRYFNYFFIRQGDYTYINKRTEKDIWKNLYEFPLLETISGMTENPTVLFSQLEKNIFLTTEMEFRLLKHGVRHVLSHRIIMADFYEVIVPEEVELVLSPTFLKVPISSLDDYAFPVLISNFLKEILDK